MDAVFLSGGGARGAYELGVLKVLLKDGPPIQLIGGASVGAVNAVVAATGQLEQLEEIWQTVSTFHILRPRLDFWRLPKWTYLLDNHRLMQRIQKEIHWDRLPNSPIQVFITATNISLRTNEVFSNSEITHLHVMASGSIPILFPPVQIGKHWYVDGAFSMLRPLKPLLQAGADRIFTVFLSPRRPRISPPNGLFMLSDRVLEVMLSSAIAADRKQIENTNEEINRLKSVSVDPNSFKHKPYRPVEVIAVHPSRDLGHLGSYLNFSGKKAKNLMDLGMSDCYQVLKRHNLI